MIFTQPNVSQKEIEYVVKAMQDGHFATGVVTEKFEDMFKEMYGYEHVVAVNSGTSALLLSLLAMGVGRGDEVIVPAYGIMCTVNAIISSGATPVFCDIDRDTYNIDPLSMAGKLTQRTKAVLPVSLFGVPCDMKGLRRNLPEGIKVLEDSIECLGSTRDGVAIGIDADAATFGFYPNKQITTGQGGVVVTQNEELADKIRRLRQHGYGPGDGLHNPGYGFNLRMPDMLAAMGIAQLERLDEMQAALLSAKAKLDTRFSGFRKQVIAANCTATEFIYGIELPRGIDKGYFCARMGALGVPVKPYFNALHRVEFLKKCIGGADCPVADKVGRKTVALPFHHELTVKDVDTIYSAFIDVTGAAL